MQPGVTVVLATVWLVVSVGVVGVATLHPTRLTLDQYSPLPPYHHGVYRRVEGQLDWKDENPGEDQPFDLSIGSRRSISANESPRRSYEVKYLGRNVIAPRAETDGLFSGDSSSLGEDKQSRNFAGSKFTDDRVGGKSTKLPEPFSREIPPSELEDPFVADDTFQDQGPGSVEIYKLDLFKEKSLLSPTTTARPLTKSKSKIPKKTSRLGWKEKTTEYKATTSPKVSEKQSDSFDESRTQVPPISSESFGVGGVPELQVGCEGLEASAHKLKRSIDSSSKEKQFASMIDPWIDVTPISLDLDYELPFEEGYEEMDELLKLKKLETTTKRVKQNRGDMEATLHSADDFFADKRPSEKLPVRGDLGKSSVGNESAIFPSTTLTGDQKTVRKEGPLIEAGEKVPQSDEDKQVQKEHADSSKSVREQMVNQGRKLLWFDDSVAPERLEDQKRSKRATWGFGEDEGVVASNELQTENQRRRQQYEWRSQEEARRRGYTRNRTNSEIDDTRSNYEKMLEQRQREEQERRRRIEQESLQRATPSRWQEEERHREDQRRREHEENEKGTNQSFRSQLEEERRRQHEEELRRRHRLQEEQRRRQETETSHRGYEHRPRNPAEEETNRQRLHAEEMRRREERRRQQQEDDRRRQQQDDERRRHQQEEERKRRLQEEDARRSGPNRWQEETQRRRQEEEDRRNLDERQREWMMKRREEEEAERRRHEKNRNESPSNLLYPFRSTPNETRRYETEADRRLREQQEREREQKLQEYIRRNRPIHVNRPTDRNREEMERRRQDEDRRRQDEERRRQDEERRRQDEERRRQEDERRRYRPVERHDPRQNTTRREDDDNRQRIEEQRRRLDEEHRRKLAEERRLQEYIRRNQLHASRTNDSDEGNWLEYRRTMEGTRPNDRSGYPGSETGRRNHGPSAPTNIDPRSYVDEARRRDEARRLEEENRIRNRQRHEDEERRKEALRREEETRRAQSRRYEEERQRLEAARRDDERRRKELIEEEARRSQAGRTRPLENTRPEYEDRRRFEEHRRRQDTSLIPGNLVLDESRRAVERERQRQEQERRILETERRRQQEHRMKETRQNGEHARAMAEQWRRQEEARLNALPVSARIIVRSSAKPIIQPRTGFANEIDFPGINPNRHGVEASRFPAAPTARPPVKSPGPCVWAVVQCCPTNNNRIVTCFESMGCPGINWDPNPCRGSIAQAARDEVMKFYAAAERDDHL